MKKLICLGIGVLVAAIAEASTVESSNVFGVLKVNSDQAETVLCVPWVGVGTGTALKASDVVLTSNLQEGDTLSAYDYNDNKFVTWVLDSNKAWVKSSSYTYNSGTTPITEPDATVDANTVAVAKGGAFILCRNGRTTSELSAPIYLSGQYSADTVSTTITGDTKKSVISFFAPPTAVKVNLNNLTPASGSFAEGDVIMIDFATQYKYSNNQWGKIGQSSGTMTIDGQEVAFTQITVNIADAKIDAGRAGWYIRKPTTPAANVVINW